MSRVEGLEVRVECTRWSHVRRASNMSWSSIFLLAIVLLVLVKSQEYESSAKCT